jgi:hypothetical protein
MSREKAIQYLDRTAEEHDPIEIKKLVGRALIQLQKSSDEDPIEFLGIVVETIEEHLHVLVGNLPQYHQDPSTKAQKYLICESELMVISEFAKDGLKARQKGAGYSAFDLVKLQKDHNLQEFDEKEETKVSISVMGENPVETTLGKFNRVAKMVQEDPSVVDRIINQEPR